MLVKDSLDFFLHIYPKTPPEKQFQLFSLLDNVLGHPHQAYDTIHIAGTNGKGSVATKIARSLRCAGYKVGLYTSPHLFSPVERIEINNSPISEEILLNKLTFLHTISQKNNLDQSFFNLCTMAALEYFKEEKVDIAIIETGLGGRLDATNVIYPLVSCITSIGYDHTQILGKTLDQIAYEKAKIIKPFHNVVLGPYANEEIFYKTAYEKKSSIYSVPLKENIFYDLENQNIAKAVLEIICKKYPLSKDAIDQGIQSRPHFRYELKTLKNRGILLFDVAHNPFAFKRLFDQVQRDFHGKDLHVLLGMSKDKDIESCLKEISPAIKSLHLVPTSSQERSMDVAQIYDLAKNILPSCSVYKYENIEEGFFKISENVSSSSLVIITGSFYIMKETNNLLTKLKK